MDVRGTNQNEIRIRFTKTETVTLSKTRDMLRLLSCQPIDGSDEYVKAFESLDKLVGRIEKGKGMIVGGVASKASPPPPADPQKVLFKEGYPGEHADVAMN